MANCKKYINDKVLPDENNKCSLCGGDCAEQDKVNEDKELTINLLNSLQEDCDMAISGEWDCSSDEGKEGFEAMIKNINTIKVIIKKHIK